MAMFTWFIFIVVLYMDYSLHARYKPYILYASLTGQIPSGKQRQHQPD